MPIVSITMIIELNKQLKEQGIPFKIHLSDACGKQSMWVEALNEDTLADAPDELYQAMEAYFLKQRMQLEYSPDKHIIWVGK